MTERTKRSIISLSLLAMGIFLVTMLLTIVGIVGRAHAQVPGALPDDPTGLFVQIYLFIKNAEHLPAVGAGLMLLVWLLRWGHEKLPAPLGPFFKTKRGGYVLGFGTAMLVYLGTAWIAHAPMTFGLIMQALGTGFAASGKWEGLMDVLKKPPAVSSTAKAAVVSLLTLALISPMFGCKPVKDEVKHAGLTTLDCTVGELADLAGLVPVILPQLGDNPDWDVVSTQLEEAGARVGTCVLANLIDRYLGNLKLATPEGSQRADSALQRVKAKHKIGAVKTVVGVR